MSQRFESDSSETLQLVGFELGGEKFGVDILCIREIIRMASITRVPRAPSFVRGIINLRGEVIPVIDLRERLRLQSREISPSTRMIVVEMDEQPVAFIVDSVSQVLRITLGEVDTPPEMVMGIEAEYIQGVLRDIDDQGKLLIILDLKRILSKAEQAAVQRVA